MLSINQKSVPIGTLFLIKVKQLFKLLVQSNTDNQSQLGSWTKLASLNRADGIPGHTHHFRQLPLGISCCTPRLFQAIFQYQFIFHVT